MSAEFNYTRTDDTIHGDRHSPAIPDCMYRSTLVVPPYTCYQTSNNGNGMACTAVAGDNSLVTPTTCN